MALVWGCILQNANVEHYVRKHLESKFNLFWLWPQKLRQKSRNDECYFVYVCIVSTVSWMTFGLFRNILVNIILLHFIGSQLAIKTSGPAVMRRTNHQLFFHIRVRLIYKNKQKWIGHCYQKFCDWDLKLLQATQHLSQTPSPLLKWSSV